MPRRRLQRSDRFPYHVTGRANDRQWFPIPMDDAWSLFARYGRYISEKFGVRIHAFVLMSNHFHMLVTTPEEDLGRVMNYFQREVSKSINRMVGRKNHTFGGPYHRCLIATVEGYHQVYKYVYRNPVVVGLSERVESYRFSTMHAVAGHSNHAIPLLSSIFDEEHLLRCPLPERLAWLNDAYGTREAADIRRGLRAGVFDPEAWV